MIHIAKSTGKPDKRLKKFRVPVEDNGRPLKLIDWAKVDELLIAGCTGGEVASYFGMHPTTFYNRVSDKFGISFTVYSQEKKQTGESILRAHQYAKALGLTKDGDNTLLIWLGKQRLNQRETPLDEVIDEGSLKTFTALIAQMDAFHEKKS